MNEKCLKQGSWPARIAAAGLRMCMAALWLASMAGCQEKAPLERGLKGGDLIWLLPLVFFAWLMLRGRKAAGSGPRFGRAAFEEDMQNARAGNPHAMVNIALAYWRGDGVDVDLSQARYWLEKAHAYGDPNALGILRRMEQDPEHPL
jgi:TPR repeat protein